MPFQSTPEEIAATRATESARRAASHPLHVVPMSVPDAERWPLADRLANARQIHALAEQHAARLSGWTRATAFSLGLPDVGQRLQRTRAHYETAGYAVVLKSAPTNADTIAVWIRPLSAITREIIETTAGLDPVDVIRECDGFDDGAEAIAAQDRSEVVAP